VGLALGLFAIANIGFVGGNVFYDAFLPHLAPGPAMDRISGRGYAFGYVGGGLLFLLNLLSVRYHAELGLGIDTAVRLGLASVGLWWGGFGLYAIRLLREAPATERLPAGESVLVHGAARTWRTLRKAARHRHLWLFLLAFVVYNDGIQTVIDMAAIYGKAELGFETGTLMGCLLMVQIVGVPGSLLFGWIAGRIGAKRAIMAALVAWTCVAFYASRMTRPAEMWVLGAVVGLILGGSQALSRSLYGSFIPKEASAEFYGFFSVFNKFSAILGPFMFAFLRQFTGTSRTAILATGCFFLVGLILLGLVDEDRASETRDLLAAS
jgi:UMF1 family MFS transporter